MPARKNVKKVCPKCKERKSVKDFCKSARMKSGYQNWCKTCMSANTMERYKKDKTKFNARNVKYKKRKLLKLYEYLKDKYCKDCGESNPLVLDFDHVKKGTKFKEISVMCNQGYSWEMVSVEIKKCEIVCANCHRIRTAHRDNWLKLDLLRGRVLGTQ